MRILHWVDYYPPYRGGTEAVVHRLATAMARNGHDVAVATNEVDTAITFTDDAAVHVRRWPFTRLLQEQKPHEILGVMRSIMAFKREFRPDIVHMHFSGVSGFFHLQSAAAHPTPTLVTIHGGLDGLNSGTRNVLGKLLADAEWVTGVSQAMVDEACRIVPDVSARSSVVYNGDVVRIRDDAPADPPYFFMSGRHVETKGMDIAIAAMPALLARWPDLRLILAGDGPLRPQFEAMARDLGVTHAVTFVGWADDAHLVELTAHSFAVLVPSRSQEGFGLVALEAALLSRPVISSAIGGLPEVVADGDTGIVLPRLDANAIVDAASALLADKDATRRMGRQAAARAAERFGLPQQVARYMALYERLSATYRAA